MADIHSPHDNVDVRINSRMYIYGPVIMSVTVPFMAVVVIVFAIWAAANWHTFLAVSNVIVIGGLVLMGLAGLGLVAGLWLKMVVHPGTRAYASVIEAKGQDARNKLIHTQDNVVVIVNEKGHLEAIPLITMQQRDIFHHKPELPERAESIVESDPLPTFVPYDKVRNQIPRGHTLVGVVENNRVITKDDGVRALLWVVGASGTGKTNTVSIRVDDDFQRGHRFLVVDPHKYKQDSLSNAIMPYASRFLAPIAQQPEDINTVLQMYLTEFSRRKNTSPPYQPLTLVIDEVGSLTMDVDSEEPLEVDIKRKVKEIARLCGQEGRGFEMYAIYISQDVAYLAWLRKRALLAIVHQVQDMEDRLRATNQDRTIARAMDDWPTGRTLVYGINFPPMVVQQPVITQRNAVYNMEPLPTKRVSSNLSNGKMAEGNGEEAGRENRQDSAENLLSTKNILRDLGRRLKNGEDRATVLRSLSASSGRANQEIGAVLDALIEEEEGL